MRPIKIITHVKASQTLAKYYKYVFVKKMFKKLQIFIQRIIRNILFQQMYTITYIKLLLKLHNSRQVCLCFINLFKTQNNVFSFTFLNIFYYLFISSVSSLINLYVKKMIILTRFLFVIINKIII